MTDEPITRGRLFLVTAANEDTAAAVALELGDRLPRCLVVAGSQVDAMVVSGRAPADHAGLEGVRHRLLRWSACLAAAETYQLEGFDAVVHDVVIGGHLEDFLDLAAPETVHVVVLDDPRVSATPRWGLWLDASAAPPGDLVGAILAHLEEAKVRTVEPGEDAASAD
ncbi:hypothetical protein [Intrasporangium sp.]|uniref:hypothetical protein n=1 Tax=Intrasporangium sp. TaxID=1925024 RepID=UPI00336557D8